MLARSLPPIEPSADFRWKLEARLQACRAQGADEGAYASFRVVAIVGAVASLLMLGYMAESLRVIPGGARGRDIVLPPVVAMAEPPDPSQPEIVGVATTMTPAGASTTGASVTGVAPASAIIASMAAGMPLWPAAVFAEQAPMHFASYRKMVH